MSIYMNNIGWGIIGVPNGFQHISEGITANSTISAVDNRLCIEDYEKEPLYAVIYDTTIVGTTNTRQLMTYFVEYNFAKEAEKKRLGSFYGSYIAIPGRLPSDIKCCEKIVKVLQELSFYNQEIFMEGNKFNKEYNNDYELPPELEKIIKDIIENTVKSESDPKKTDSKKSIIVYGDSSSEVFLNSVELYDTYSIIYISKSKEYCEYVEQNKNIICKRTVDLIKESSDIIDARQREINRRKKEEQDRLEAEQVEKQKQKQLFDDKVQSDKDKAIDEFNGLRELYLYTCVDRSNLNASIKSFKDSSDSSSVEELKLLSENLEKYIELSNKFSKDIEDKKSDIDQEIIRLEGITDLLNSQSDLEQQQQQQQQQQKKSQQQQQQKKSQQQQQQRKSQQQRQSDSSSFGIYIWVAVIVLILLIIGFGLKNMFFNKKSDSVRYQQNITTSQNLSNDMDSSIQDSKVYSVAIISDDTVIPESLVSCNYDQSELRDYTVSIENIRDIDTFDSPRYDNDVISQVTDSILNKEQGNTVISVDLKSKFQQMLMDCNESLNLNKHGSLGSKSNLLPIKPDDIVRYVSMTSLK